MDFMSVAHHQWKHVLSSISSTQNVIRQTSAAVGSRTAVWFSCSRCQAKDILLTRYYMYCLHKTIMQVCVHAWTCVSIGLNAYVWIQIKYMQKSLLWRATCEWNKENDLKCGSVSRKWWEKCHFLSRITVNDKTTSCKTQENIYV